MMLYVTMLLEYLYVDCQGCMQLRLAGHDCTSQGMHSEDARSSYVIGLLAYKLWAGS